MYTPAMNARPTITSLSRFHVSLLLFALALIALASFALGGCASMPRMLGGGNGDVLLNVDGEQKHETSVPHGQTLTLDMRDPGPSGYGFAGTVFDPNMMRLEAIEQPEGVARARYVFTALRPGETDIQIKIHKLGQAGQNNQAGQKSQVGQKSLAVQRAELFKFVTVKVE